MTFQGPFQPKPLHNSNTLNTILQKHDLQIPHCSYLCLPYYKACLIMTQQCLCKKELGGKIISDMTSHHPRREHTVTKPPSESKNENCLLILNPKGFSSSMQPITNFTFSSYSSLPPSIFACQSLFSANAAAATTC